MKLVGRPVAEPAATAAAAAVVGINYEACAPWCHLLGKAAGPGAAFSCLTLGAAENQNQAPWATTLPPQRRMYTAALFCMFCKP